jgi:hypothetical protein
MKMRLLLARMFGAVQRLIGQAEDFAEVGVVQRPQVPDRLAQLSDFPRTLDVRNLHDFPSAEAVGAWAMRHSGRVNQVVFNMIIGNAVILSASTDDVLRSVDVCCLGR